MHLKCGFKRIFKCVETDAVLCQLNYQVNWDLIEDWNQCFYLCHVLYSVRMKPWNFVPLGFFSCIAPLKVCPCRKKFCATCYSISRAYVFYSWRLDMPWRGLGGGVNEVTLLQCFPRFSRAFSSVLEFFFPRQPPASDFPAHRCPFFPALCHLPCFLSLCKDFKPLKQSLSSFVCLLIFAAYIGGRRRQFTFKFDQATGDSS